MYNVSVIIPAYNESKLLPACIISVQEALESSPYVHNYEVIVVDNNSTDDTAVVAADLDCIVVCCKQKGVTRARQMGFETGKYEFQTYIDADNTVPIDYFDHIVNLDDPEIVAISGPVYYYDADKFTKSLTRVFYSGAMIMHRLIGPSIQGGNFSLKKSALAQVNGMPTDIDFFSEDTFLAKRISKVGKVKLVPKMWVYSSARRLRAEGAFHTAWIYTLNYFSVYTKNAPHTVDYEDHR